MIRERRFAFMVLGTLGLAACGGGDTTAGGPTGATGGSTSETGGTSSSGGSGGSGGTSSGSGGTSSGGSGGSITGAGGAATGGATASGGTSATGGAGTGGTTADADGGPSPDAGGPTDDGGNAGDAGPDANPLPAPAGVVAFAYANSHSAAVPYSPAGSYSYNASGGAITIEHKSTGTYTVTFADLDPPMRNAQVTAYDHTGYCSIAQLTGTTATVRCYDNAGALMDAKFSLAAFGPAEARASVTAYAFADQASAAQYGANANYSYNSGGGGITATRSMPGTYALEFTGIDLSTGNVQLTSLDPANHCTIVSWSGSSVSAICYNALGQRTDTKYLAMVLQKGPSDSRVLGYARSISDTDAQSDLTGGMYTFNSTGGTIVSERTGTGAYTVTFAGASFDTAHPQACAWFTDRHCEVTAWGAAWVKIACANAAGDPSDSLFSVAVVE